MALPNLFIVGAPKCGTTALSEYLSGHPEIFSGYVKEPNFWSSDMPYFALREGFDSREAYEAMYRKSPVGAKYRIDASTHYLYSEVAVAQIAREYPDAKFVVCIRPQVELAVAWHMQMCIAGYEDVSDFERAWSLRVERRVGRRIPAACPEPRLLDYEAVASLGTQIRRMLKIVPQERVQVVFLSELGEDPAGAYRACLRFLGLQDDARCDFTPRNVASRARSARLSRFVRGPAVRRWLNRVASLLGPGAPMVRNVLKKGLYAPARRERLRPAFQRELDAAFHDDDRLLNEVLGRSFYTARAVAPATMATTPS